VAAANRQAILTAGRFVGTVGQDGGCVGEEERVVTVGDAGYWSYQGLMSMPRRIYLVAMWILCGELRELYAP